MPSDLLAAGGGLLAALWWGAGDFGGGIAAKRIPAFVAILVSQLVGLAAAVAAALVLAEAVPSPVDAAWAAGGAIFGAIGLAGLYRALADGQMGIVAPITGVLTATIPVAIGIAATGLPDPVRLVGMGLAVVAILLVSSAADGAAGGGGLGLALAAGVCFGLYSACVGQIEGGVFAPIAVARATSSALVLLILVARRTPVRSVVRGERRAVGVALLVGLLDLAGNAAFLFSAQVGGLALAAILGSLYPVGTVILAAVVLGERIGRVHAIGIVMAALAAVLIIGGG